MDTDATQISLWVKLLSKLERVCEISEEKEDLRCITIYNPRDKQCLGQIALHSLFMKFDKSWLQILLTFD